MSEYNELIVSELFDLTEKIDELLKREDSANARGVAAMLIVSGVMMDSFEPGQDDVMVVTQCLDLLSDHPGSVAMLLAQIGKGLALQHMKVETKKEVL